jgi:hypothetical protein
MLMKEESGRMSGLYCVQVYIREAFSYVGIKASVLSEFKARINYEGQSEVVTVYEPRNVKCLPFSSALRISDKLKLTFFYNLIPHFEVRAEIVFES